jgi:lysozyme
MTTSPAGRKLIESFEGCRLTAYQDQRGILTIGYGHTASVKLGDTCTPQQADEWLTGDLATAEGAVNRLVRVPLAQNQFDALVSLCFNIGQGNFAESTVLRLVNGGSVEGSAEAFLMWDKVGGQANVGLFNRRTAEKTLFLTAQV